VQIRFFRSHVVLKKALLQFGRSVLRESRSHVQRTRWLGAAVIELAHSPGRSGPRTLDGLEGSQQGLCSDRPSPLAGRDTPLGGSGLDRIS
jgi:hypothetical protein